MDVQYCLGAQRSCLHAKDLKSGLEVVTNILISNAFLDMRQEQ